MGPFLRYFIKFALGLLLLTLLFGVLSSWSFLYPEASKEILPFYQLRPMHVSAALFWILTGATACILYYRGEALQTPSRGRSVRDSFILLWILTIAAVFIFYGFRKFGGREYWEFPAWLSIPFLLSWLLLMWFYFRSWRKSARKKPLYIIMWSTGILFFMITFVEQSLWQIEWFRASFVRELTVQWKANGSMVGAWNQMIYGTSLFLMVKLSGDDSVAGGRQAYAFYFLGLANLMFNWGHHIYNLPSAGWIRHVSYAVSMTEWILFISIIRGFRRKMDEQRRFRHLIPYRFLLAAEAWVFLNLLLALFMSVPALNRYTHGTHITVAHAMGTTIGINTMILLAGFGSMLRIDRYPAPERRFVHFGFIITQVSLSFFWCGLIAAGLIRAYRDVVLGMKDFGKMMQPVLPALYISAVAGVGLLGGIGTIVICYWRALKGLRRQHGHDHRREYGHRHDRRGTVTRRDPRTEWAEDLRDLSS